MASWHIIIEIKKTSIDEVEVIVDGIEIVK